MGSEQNLMVYRGDRSIESLAEEFELLIKNRIKINGTSTEEVFSKDVRVHEYIWLSNHFVNFTFYFSDDQESQETQKQWAEIYEEEYDVKVDFCIDTAVFGDNDIFLLDVVFDYIKKHREHDLSLAEIEGSAILVYRKGKLYLNRTFSKKYSNLYPFEIFDDFPSFDVELLQEDIRRENAKTSSFLIRFSLSILNITPYSSGVSSVHGSSFLTSCFSPKSFCAQGSGLISSSGS